MMDNKGYFDTDIDPENPPFHICGSGVGLKTLGNQKWYGGGYCKICGDTKIVPQMVKFWDPDDGWKVGCLCRYCAEEVRDRGPREGDYALRDQEDKSEKIDIIYEILGNDLDGAQSMIDDLG